MSEPASSPARPPGPPPVRRRLATIINLVYQYAGVALTVVRGIVMVPILLAYLPLELYGAWMASGDIIAWVLLTEAGTADLIRQQVAQHFGAGRNHEAGQAVGAGLALSLVLAVVVVGIGLLISPAAPGWVNYEGEHAGQLSAAVLWAVIATALGIVCGGVRGAQQGLQRPLGVGVVGICAETLSIAVSIVLLVAGWGLYAIPGGFILRECVNLVGCFALFGLTARELHIPLGLSRQRLWALTHLTGWTFLSRLGAALGGHVQSFLVARFVGPAWVPMAVLTRRAWEILFLLLSRLSFSFQPGLAHVWGSGNLTLFQDIVHRMLLAVLATTAVASAAAWALNSAFMRLWLAGDPLYAGPAYNLLTGLATILNILLFTVCQVVLAGARIRESAVAQLLPSIANGVLLVAGLYTAAALQLPPRDLLLAVPLAAMLAVGCFGLPYALAQWAAATRFGRERLLGQALATGRLVSVAALGALAWSVVPQAESWPMLVLHGAAVTLAVTLGVVAVEPGIRSPLRGAAAAVRRARQPGTSGAGNPPAGRTVKPFDRKHR